MNGAWRVLAPRPGCLSWGSPIRGYCRAAALRNPRLLSGTPSGVHIVGISGPGVLSRCGAPQPPATIWHPVRGAYRGDLRSGVAVDGPRGPGQGTMVTPEGCQTVAGGSGTADHRKRERDRSAPRRGARPWPGGRAALLFTSHGLPSSPRLRQGRCCGYRGHAVRSGASSGRNRVLTDRQTQVWQPSAFWSSAAAVTSAGRSRVPPSRLGMRLASSPVVSAPYRPG